MIKQEDFVNSLFGLFEETFETHHGIYLDKDTSLFQTLETVTAEEASIPVGGKCASLAAQVAHVTFYLEVLERYVMRNDTSPADWGEIWRMVEKVTPQEWDSYKSKLKDASKRPSHCSPQQPPFPCYKPVTEASRLRPFCARPRP